MLEANAAAIGAQTREIGEMQNNPVIALESVKNAYNSLIGAMARSRPNMSLPAPASPS